MSRADVDAYYRDEIAVEMRADGLDPDRETPTYRWLMDHGYGGLVSYLRREFDLSPGEWFDEMDEPPVDTGYWAAVDDDATRECLQSYVDELADLRGHPDTTVSAIRSRLRKYALLYEETTDAAVVAGLEDVDERVAEIDRCLSTFQVLVRQLSTPASRHKYLGDVRRFYQWVIDTGRAAYNPVERFERRLNLDAPDWDNPTLARDDVALLADVADSRTDRLVVVGLCGWGLRPSELCALRLDQVVFGEDDVPYIDFPEGSRKNGPGTVSILVGRDVLDARIDALASDDDWTGYLFPSSRSASGHRGTGWVRDHFGSLADRAGVTVDGETPTPKMGRRWWYAQYTEAWSELLDRIGAVAAEQGSASAEVVAQNYLSEERRRSLRREAMQDEIVPVFEGIES
jgi:integrase